MKKTEYFISKHSPWSSAKEAINDVVAQREKFLEKNLNLIAEIDSENLELTDVNSGGYIYALLTLTYYLK